MLSLEGHLLLLPKEITKNTGNTGKKRHRILSGEEMTCKPHKINHLKPQAYHRVLREAGEVVGLTNMEYDIPAYGKTCGSTGSPHLHEIEVIFSYQEDRDKGGFRMIRHGEHLYVNTIAGIPIKLATYDGDSMYSVTNVNGIPVKKNENVRLWKQQSQSQTDTSEKQTHGHSILDLTYFANREHDDPFDSDISDEPSSFEPLVERTIEFASMVGSVGAGVEISTEKYDLLTYKDPVLLQGCKQYDPALVREVEGRAVLLQRGGCSFSEKVYHAQQAGAVMAIIANTQDSLIDMVGDSSLPYSHPLNIPALSISNKAAESIWKGIGILHKIGLSDSFLPPNHEPNDRMYSKVSVKIVDDPTADENIRQTERLYITFSGKPIQNIEMIDFWPF
jgi:hypothetical protein